MLPKLDGSRGGGPRTTRITQRQLRRDKRAAHQISHSCTQHHGHAPRPDTLWHHNAHGRPKGQWPSVLCTLAYPLGLGGLMGAAWLWTWPKNDSLGNMALNWFRAWSTMGCDDKCAGASADAIHPRWIARLGGKSNTGQSSANEGGTSAPRARSLIAARSIMAMRQDQTRYGTTTLTVSPRANGPLSFAR